MLCSDLHLSLIFLPSHTAHRSLPLYATVFFYHPQLWFANILNRNYRAEVYKLKLSHRPTMLCVFLLMTCAGWCKLDGEIMQQSFLKCFSGFFGTFEDWRGILSIECAALCCCVSSPCICSRWASPYPSQEPRCKTRAGGGEGQARTSGCGSARRRCTYSIAQERAKGWSLNTAPELWGRGRFLTCFPSRTSKVTQRHRYQS